MSRLRSTICLIVPYFGTLPSYVQCVFRSCQFNPDIDWLIFTDDNTVRELPPNVHIRRATLGALRERFSQKLGFEVTLIHPYQLCNFRPAYGYLFADVLTDYDFWGHCDLDVIFGDLRKFLREDILSAYNKILNRGHLCLYRNTAEVNRYFMLEAPRSLNYRAAFCDTGLNVVEFFDEWRGIYRILRYHNIPQYHDEFIIDVIPPTRWIRSRFEGTAIKNHAQQVFYWYKGKVFQSFRNCDGGTMDAEYAYIHLQKRRLPAPGFDPYHTDGFLITPDGFFPYSREELLGEDWRKYNRTRLRPFKELINAAYRRLPSPLRRKS